MKKHQALLIAMLSLAYAAPAHALVAIAPQSYACTPDGFTLSQDVGGLKLAGTLETPSPNYTYTLNVDDNQHVLTLTTPSEAQLAVIDNIAIDSTIFNTDDNGDLTITIKKDFNWGPDTITCKLMNKGNEK